MQKPDHHLSLFLTFRRCGHRFSTLWLFTTLTDTCNQVVSCHHAYDYPPVSLTLVIRCRSFLNDMIIHRSHWHPQRGRKSSSCLWLSASVTDTCNQILSHFSMLWLFITQTDNHNKVTSRHQRIDCSPLSLTLVIGSQVVSQYYDYSSHSQSGCSQ